MRTESADKSFQKKSRDRKDQNCKYCGLKHAKRNCPAYGKTCHKCGRKNHFATVCKTKINSVKNLEAENHNSDELYSIAHEIGMVKSKG